MANVIKHKRGSGSDPVASDLVVGEVAIRTDVGKLFTKMDNGSVAEIAGGGSDIAINTLSSSSATGGGSATFNGSAYRFTLSAPPSVSAQQLLVSINGVIQKPVAGTGQPSEGFSVDGTDIILGDAPATGSDFFILTFKSLGVSEPADNSVTSAKIVDGAIVNADINASAAIAGTKISPDFGSQAIATTGSATIGTDLIHAGDTDTKIRFPTVDTVSLETGAAERLRVDNSNTVFNEAGANIDFRIESDTKTHMFFLDAGNDRIGINTSSPTCMLQINDTATSGDGVTEILRLNGSPNNNNDGIKLQFARVGSAAGSITLQKVADNNTTDMIFGTRSFNTESETMRLTGAGRVGIGEDAPQQKLHLHEASSSGNFMVFTNSTTGATGNDGVLFGINSDEGGTIWNQENTYIRFGTNDTERMRIDSLGKIGIGTTSPASFLEIASHNNAETDKHDASNYHLHLRNTENDNGEAIGISFAITSDETAVGAAILHERDAGGSQGSLQFLTNSNGSSVTERMRIDSSGRMLLGTTTASAFTDRLLTVASSGGAGIEMRAGTSSISQLSFSDGSGSDNSGYRGFISYQHASDLMQIGVAASARINITSAGNVGIGTGSPTQKLHVSGDALIAGAAGGTLLLGGSAAHTSKFVIGDNSGSGNGNLVIEGGDGSDFIKIASNGNVGIKTTSPIGTLDVHDGTFVLSKPSSNSSSRNWRFLPDNIAAGNLGLQVSTAAGGSTFQNVLEVDDDGTIFTAQNGTAFSWGSNPGHVWYADGEARSTTADGVHYRINRMNGNGHAVQFYRGQTNMVGFISITSSGTSYGSGSSDERTKKNIEDWSESVLNKFKSLTPKLFNFNWEDDTAAKHKGYIAQNEVNKFPEAYPKNNLSDTEDEFYTFTPTDMTVYLMKGLKEAAEKIETLEAKITALEAT